MYALYQSTLDRNVFINPALVAAISHVKIFAGGHEITFHMSGADDIKLTTKSQRELVTELNVYKAFCKSLEDNTDTALAEVEQGEPKVRTPAWREVGVASDSDSDSDNVYAIWAYRDGAGARVYRLSKKGEKPTGTGGYFNALAACAQKGLTVQSLVGGEQP